MKLKRDKRAPQNMKYHYSYILFFFFIVLVLFPLAFSISINTLSPTESLTISSNRTITSPGNVFELGFFKPGANSRWFLGIWYKKVPERTYVWVANRDKPLRNHKGTLKISDTNLVLLDYSNNPIWSTNLTKGDKRSPMVAELLDNGNFVLKDSRKNRFLWQSFDFPTDTLLPEMKLGKNLKTGVNRFLRSWRSPNDPSSGDVSFKLETRGFPEFFLYIKDTQMHRTGPWDGVRFSGVPAMQKLNYMVSNFTETRDEVFYTFKMTNQSIYSRITISPSGIFKQFIWNPKSWGWNLVLISPKDQCDLYNSCAPYGYCDMKTSPVCNCIKGFKPRNPKEWALKDGSEGCVWRTRPRCGRDGFLRLKKMKLPDTTRAIVDKRIGIKECEKRCVRDCKCTAFANTDIRNGGSGCVIWTGELVDLRNFDEGGQDLYVRSSDYGY